MASRRAFIYSSVPGIAKLVRKGLNDDVAVTEVKFKGIISHNYEVTVSPEELSVLQEAEVLLVDPHLLATITDKLPKLKWAQSTWTGVEMFKKCLENKPEPHFVLSRMATETTKQLMAEYVLGWILSHERAWLETRQNQLKGEWKHSGNMACYRSLRELTVGVLGAGSIGKEVARCLKTFHTTVLAFTRSAPAPEHKSKHVDKYWHTGELAQFLGQCDYIVNIMPSTSETTGMLDRDAFKHAKKGAVFVNVGRGDVVSEEGLVRALDAGWLSAAILDVFLTEPLPKESRLWKHPKVVITPHTACVSRPEDIAESFLDNYELFISGQEVNYVYDWKSAY